MIKSYKLRRNIANAIIYVLLAILGILWVSPFAYLLMHSFRLESMTTVPYLIPHVNAPLPAYLNFLSSSSMPRYEL